MHSKSYAVIVSIGHLSPAGPMFLLDNNSQDFWPLSLTMHFATLKFHCCCPAPCKQKGWGIGKLLGAQSWPLCRDWTMCNCVCGLGFFFFLIVKSCKQKSPERGKILARQISSWEWFDTFFFFFNETKRCLGLSPSNRDRVCSCTALHFGFWMPVLHHFKLSDTMVFGHSEQRITPFFKGVWIQRVARTPCSALRNLIKGQHPNGPPRMGLCSSAGTRGPWVLPLLIGVCDSFGATSSLPEGTISVFVNKPWPWRWWVRLQGCFRI